MKTWEYKIYEVAERAYAYVSPGHFAMNNPGLVAGERCAIAIDSMSGVKETKWFADECAKLDGGTPVRFFVYTHNHSDHTLGAHIYEDAVIMGQRDLVPILAKGRIPKQAFSPLDLTGARITMPQLVFDKRLTIDLGGRTAEIMAMGHCHSATDTIVYIPEIKTVYCGDLLYTYELPDGSMCRVDAWLEALDKIAALDAEVFVPGHGPIADREELQRSRRLLQTIYDQSVAGFQKGAHQVETIRALDLGEFEEYAEPARRVTLVDSIYRSLTTPYQPMPQWNVNEEMDRIRHAHGDFEKHFVVPFAQLEA